MENYFLNLSDTISIFHLNILLLIGFSLIGGTLGGRIFQKLKIPQVVGYITIGIIIGTSGVKILDVETVKAFEPFNYFALGMIGFMIGGELKMDVLSKFGKQFLIILFAEGLAAFVVVTLLIGFIGMIFIHDAKLVWSLAILLGAISSATAPAATTDVLWEYKAKGPLTRTVLGIVALDDGLALLLFAIASSVAASLMGDSLNILESIFTPIYEIVGSLMLGFLLGFFMGKILKRYNEDDKILVFSIGIVLTGLGLAALMSLNILLAAMTMGVTVVNLSPYRSKELFKLIQNFTPPIYILFFVLVGAKLNVQGMSLSVIFLLAAYLTGRTLGKMYGASFGAKLSGAPATVIKNLPLCLFSQAGVAIGLSIIAGQKFQSEIGNMIVIIITASTFVVQLIGPYYVKMGITRAGEVGLNITEEDLIKKCKASDIMAKNVPIIKYNFSIKRIIKIFTENENLYYPVVNEANKLIGIVTVDNIRQTILYTEASDLLLAHDLMERVIATVNEETPLTEVKELIDRLKIDYLPVITSEKEIVGFIEVKNIQKLISQKIAEIEKKAVDLQNS
jgi:Kef-type K+ transport system membrane component KefB/predicted transcriptional regulator